MEYRVLLYFAFVMIILALYYSCPQRCRIYFARRLHFAQDATMQRDISLGRLIRFACAAHDRRYSHFISAM